MYVISLIAKWLVVPTYNYPTNIVATRATPLATPLVALSDKVEICVALGCSKGSFSFFAFF